MVFGLQFHVTLKDKQDGRNIEETVQSDTTDDIVTYHMKKDGVEQWVLNDFGKVRTIHPPLTVVNND